MRTVRATRYVALYFHHTSEDFLERTGDPFPRIEDHVLLPVAGDLHAADRQLTARITRAAIDGIVTLVPGVWLGTPALRGAYAEYLERRLLPPRAFVEEAIRARSLLI